MNTSISGILLEHRRVRARARAAGTARGRLRASLQRTRSSVEASLGHPAAVPISFAAGLAAPRFAGWLVNDATRRLVIDAFRIAMLYGHSGQTGSPPPDAGNTPGPSG